MSQSAAMLEAAAQAKKVRDREMTKSKKPSTLKKVGRGEFSLLSCCLSRIISVIACWLAACMSLCS